MKRPVSPRQHLPSLSGIYKISNAFLCAIMVYLIHLCFLKTSPPKIIVCLASRKLLPNYKFLYQLLKSLDIDDFMIDSFLITFTGEWGLNIIIFILIIIIIIIIIIIMDFIFLSDRVSKANIVH